MSDFDPNAIYRQMSDDELAEMVLSLKEQMADLRTTCWKAEDELRNRLMERNAKRLQGDRFLVKSSIKREIKWDQAKLQTLLAIAEGEGLTLQVHRALDVELKPKLRELNELLKFGGRTAEAIEAAKTEVNEKIELAFEAL